MRYFFFFDFPVEKSELGFFFGVGLGAAGFFAWGFLSDLLDFVDFDLRASAAVFFASRALESSAEPGPGFENFEPTTSSHVTSSPNDGVSV